MNTINKLQNAKQQLDYLAAQSQLYSEAKKTLLIRSVLAIPIVIIVSVIAAVYSQTQAYAALYGIAVALSDLVILRPLQKSVQEKAAKIQELFDAKVLQIRWNDLKTGTIPAAEEIFAASSRYLKKNINYSPLKNWYPPSAGKPPIYLGRLICQRANCWWDAKLRKKYAFLLVALTLILTVLVFLIGLIGGMTLEKFVLVIATPLLPIYVFSIKEIQDQMESANSIDQIRAVCEDTWVKILNKEIYEKKVETISRDLQDEIFERRKNGPLIFSWIYMILRSGYEKQMNKGSESLVKEVLSIK